MDDIGMPDDVGKKGPRLVIDYASTLARAGFPDGYKQELSMLY